jgi:hypothetical protein
LSGRTMARTGLRMMPTFPSSPLSAARRVFLVTAGRLAYQAGLSWYVDQLKPAPGIHCPSYQLVVALRASAFDPPKVGSVDAITAPPCGGLCHLPQGPSLRIGLCYPGPSSLSRPHPPRSQAHRDFAARRLIRGAFAVRERLGDPRAVPVFRCSFLPDMPSPKTPGSSDTHKFQRRGVDIGLRQSANGSALPRLPQLRFTRVCNNGASTVHPFATACQVARRPVRI